MTTDSAGNLIPDVRTFPTPKRRSAWERFFNPEIALLEIREMELEELRLQIRSKELDLELLKAKEAPRDEETMYLQGTCYYLWRYLQRNPGAQMQDGDLIMAYNRCEAWARLLAKNPVMCPSVSAPEGFDSEATIGTDLKA